MEESKFLSNIQEETEVKILQCLCCKILEHIIVSNMIKHLDQHEFLLAASMGFEHVVRHSYSN